eukprot:672459-Ditylum_brightwellii.AAC.3
MEKGKMVRLSRKVRGRLNIGTDQEIKNDDPDHQPELRERELQLFNGAKVPIEDSGELLPKDNGNENKMGKNPRE